MQKAEIVESIEVARLPGGLGIDYSGFSSAVWWFDYERHRLKKYILDPFSAALNTMTGYSDEVRPVGKTDKNINAGDAVFAVTTTPQGKRISYSNVVTAFSDYVLHLEEFYKQDRLREGFRTLRGSGGLDELFIRLDVLESAMDGYLKSNLEGKEGVKQESVLVGPEQWKSENAGSLTVAIGRDYGVLNTANAHDYFVASSIEEDNKGAVSRFKKALKQDAFSRYGGEPKSIVEFKYPFGQTLFINQVEPRAVVKYDGIVEDFIKPPPEKLTSRSAIGDFQILRMMHGGQEPLLAAKDLVDPGFREEYYPREIDGNVYVRAQGVKSRFEKHTKERTSTTFEQNIRSFPVRP